MAAAGDDRGTRDKRSQQAVAGWNSIRGTFRDGSTLATDLPWLVNKAKPSGRSPQPAILP
jgi:hypothetical protein